MRVCAPQRFGARDVAGGLLLTRRAIASVAPRALAVAQKRQRRGSLLLLDQSGSQTPAGMDQDDQKLACRFPALLDPFVNPHPWPQRPGDEEQSHKVASGRGRHDAQTDGDRKDEQEGDHTPGRRRSAAPRMDFGGQTRHTRDSKDCPACDPGHHAQPVISPMRWRSKLLAPRVTVSRRVALKTRSAALPLWSNRGSADSARC